MVAEAIRHWPLAIILAVQTCILYDCSRKSSPTPDEFPHIVGGLHHVANGGNQFYNVNPPLVKLLAVLPSTSECVALPANSKFDYTKFKRPEFRLGDRFFEQQPAVAKLILYRARLMMIAIASLGTAGVYVLTRMLLKDNQPSRRSSILLPSLAAVVYSFSPMILGYAAFVQTDVTAATAIVWLVTVGLIWSRSTTPVTTVIFGIVFGFALCTKYTLWIGFCILPFFLLLRDSLSPSISRSIFHYLCVCVIAIAMVNLIVGGTRPWQRLGDYQFSSRKLAGLGIGNDQTLLHFGNRFDDTVASKVIVPFPPTVLEGVDIQIRDMQDERPSLIFGEHRSKGVWWFYLAGLLVKTPVGFLAIAMIALFGIVLTRELMVAGIVFPLAIMMLISSNYQFNSHVRYAIPVYPFFCVLSAVGCFGLLQKLPTMKLRKLFASTLALGCLVGVVEVAFWHPYHLPFVNLVGLKAFGREEAIGGSGLDWDHGWVAFCDYLRENEANASGSSVILIKPSHRGLRYADVSLRPIDAKTLRLSPLSIAVLTEDRRQLQGQFGTIFQKPPSLVIAGSIEVYSVSKKELEWIRFESKRFWLAKANYIEETINQKNEPGKEQQQ